MAATKGYDVKNRPFFLNVMALMCAPTQINRFVDLQNCVFLTRIHLMPPRCSPDDCVVDRVTSQHLREAESA